MFSRSFLSYNTKKKRKKKVDVLVDVLLVIQGTSPPFLHYYYYSKKKRKNSLTRFPGIEGWIEVCQAQDNANPMKTT